MWLKSLHLINVKSFANSGTIEFAEGINLLVGPNNAGKSTLIRSVSLLQPLPSQADVAAFFVQTKRHGSENGEVVLTLASPNRHQLTLPPEWEIQGWHAKLKFAKSTKGPIEVMILTPSNKYQGIAQPICPQKQPDNFLFTYLSRRKPTAVTETINLANAQTIEDALQHLPSKVDVLTNSRHSGVFNDICQKTLGFTVSCIHSTGGKQLGLVLEDERIIPVTLMGEGTLNILVFLVHLAAASGKLFLIEEIENDLHPAALKCLLEFIITKSKTNQFLISTHSNIVAKYLGAVPGSKLFSVEMKLDDATRIPTSECKLIDENPESRIRLLESLG